MEPAPGACLLLVRSPTAMTTSEEHFLLRLPDDVADEVRGSIRTGGDVDLKLVLGSQTHHSTARQGTFMINGRELPAALCALPSVVETHKSLDGVTFYKSGYVRETIVVADDEEKLPTDTELVDGLAPALADVRKKRWHSERSSRDKKQVEQVALELESMLRPGLPLTRPELVTDSETDPEDEDYEVPVHGGSASHAGLGASERAEMDPFAHGPGGSGASRAPIARVVGSACGAAGGGGGAGGSTTIRITNRGGVAAVQKTPASKDASKGASTSAGASAPLSDAERQAMAAEQERLQVRALPLPAVSCRPPHPMMYVQPRTGDTHCTPVRAPGCAMCAKWRDAACAH